MEDMGGIAPLLGYIEDAIGQYVSRRTIEGRRAEEVLDDLIGFISSGECSVPLPERRPAASRTLFDEEDLVSLGVDIKAVPDLEALLDECNSMMWDGLSETDIRWDSLEGALGRMGLDYENIKMERELPGIPMKR